MCSQMSIVFYDNVMHGLPSLCAVCLIQVLWGGRWQEGSACTTGEEVEQINAHMSRCGNTTKYMLPEGMGLSFLPD